MKWDFQFICWPMLGLGVFRDFLSSLQICKSRFESIFGFLSQRRCSDACLGFNALFLPDVKAPPPLL